jgi:phenylalanyl-tRNA synthetase beta subunit
MNIPSSWINKYLCRTMLDDQLIKAMEQAGIEIEQYSSSKPIDEKVIIGLAKKVVQHPNADRLNLVEVVVPRGTLHIVCGAPNVASGQKVAVAQVGTTLPSGDVITEAKLRGEVSEGMLCSRRELGLGEDHDGILVLDDSIEIGTKLAQLYPSEAIIEITTPANRYDLLSIIGIAREVAAQSDNELKLPVDKEILPGNGPKVDITADEQLVPRFMVAELTLRDVEPLPKDMTSHLEAAGMRSISPIVDLTNYLMLAFGQPCHAYDADKVKGNLGVRMAKTGEVIETLDGVKRKLTKDDLVIVDNDGPVGLAGVMGGARTEVDASTKRILLEMATFDGATIRRMAKRHGLRSEASARFERGLPLPLSPAAMNHAVALFAKYAGGKLVGLTDELRLWPWIQRVGLRHSYLEKMLGIDLSFDEAIKSLAKVGVEGHKFDLVEEAKFHIGKPYKFGAKFRVDGTAAFDCSYLTDYLYSLIGVKIGHTAHQQFKYGRPVELAELVPGDLLFRDGPWDKLDAEAREHVSHVAIYIGNDEILHAVDIQRDSKQVWKPRDNAGVLVEPLENIAKDPLYLGARRFVDNLDDFISVPMVPWWRPDIKEPADLVEEIVKVIGYDRIPARLPQWRPNDLKFDRRTPRRWQLQSALQSLGLFEVMTYSFVSEQQLTNIGHEPGTHLKLKNPLSSEQAYLRSTVLPSLLTVIERNHTYGPSFGLYELTRVFEPTTKGKLPDEPYRLAIIVKDPEAGYSVIKGLIDQLTAEMGVNFEVGAVLEDTNFVPGRLVELTVGKKTLGVLGELSPEVARRIKAGGKLGYAELDLDLLLENAGPKPYRDPSRFPSISRDLNLQLDLAVTWQQVNALISASGLAQATFVNDYYGDKLPEGKKNLAVRLVMNDPGKTLTDADAEQRLREISAKLKKQLGAVVI